MQINYDVELAAVHANLEKISDLQRTVGAVMRQALDEVIDGPRTGRHCIDDLEKTEKTYIGTKVEILLRHALELSRGNILDNFIAGYEVDTKFSLTSGWMIPQEARGSICLLATLDERNSTASLGLLRMTPQVLTNGKNRDGKCTVSATGKKEIQWLLEKTPMPENFLLHLDESLRNLILMQSSGKRRVEELFMGVTNKLIPRSVVLQVIQLPGDPLKRAREAKKNLSARGYRVLCANYNSDSAQMIAAGFTPESSDDWLSLKIDT